jgi:outer membrane protein assembly factor BamB
MTFIDRSHPTRRALLGPLAVVMALSTLSASRPVAPGDWFQFQYDAAHTGFNPDESILTTANVGTLQVAWETAGGTGTGTVAVSGGVVFQGDRRLKARDAKTGSLLWRADPMGWVRDTPAVADGLVYVGTGNGRLLAFDEATGSRVWAFRRDHENLSGPTVDAGVVYVASDDHRLFALDGATGGLLWSRRFPSVLFPAPTVAGGIVYEVAGGPTDSFLYALDSVTGSPLWKQPIADSAGPSPVVSGGNVYVVSLAVVPTVGAFDATSGAPIWSFIPSRTGVLSGPAIAGGVLYSAGGDRVYALDAATGEKVWTATTHFAEANPPAIANGVLYLALVGDTSDKGVFALDVVTGGFLWHGGGLPTSLGPPVVADGMVYVTGFPDLGHMWAYGLLH